MPIKATERPGGGSGCPTGLVSRCLAGEGVREAEKRRPAGRQEDSTRTEGAERWGPCVRARTGEYEGRELNVLGLRRGREKVRMRFARVESARESTTSGLRSKTLPCSETQLHLLFYFLFSNRAAAPKSRSQASFLFDCAPARERLFARPHRSLLMLLGLLALSFVMPI